jgi:hypothetical protein
MESHIIRNSEFSLDNIASKLRLGRNDPNTPLFINSPVLTEHLSKNFKSGPLYLPFRFGKKNRFPFLQKLSVFGSVKIFFRIDSGFRSSKYNGFRFGSLVLLQAISKENVYITSVVNGKFPENIRREYSFYWL